MNEKKYESIREITVNSEIKRANCFVILPKRTKLSYIICDYAATRVHMKICIICKI